VSWCGIFRYLENGVSMDPPRATATEKELITYYDKCVTFLKERVSYCFKNGKGVNALEATQVSEATRHRRIIRRKPNRSSQLQ